MKNPIKILLPLGAALSILLLTGFVHEAADIFAGLGTITDTISDINDAVIEEDLIKKQIESVHDQEIDIQNSLREMDYTESEINDILGVAGHSQDSNTLLVLRRAAQNIKRAKALIERLKITGKINPDVATAGYSAMSAKSLTDIKILLSQVIYNQNRDYQDRILERAKEKKLQDKKRKALHEESLAVRAGKKTLSKDEEFIPPRAPSANSASGRFKNWWSNGRTEEK